MTRVKDKVTQQIQNLPNDTSFGIASRSRRISINTGAIKAAAVKSYVDVTGDIYPMLGFLDALKDFKQIPDVDMGNAMSVFKNRIGQLTQQQRQAPIQYASAYPPWVRALLGAILTTLGVSRGRLRHCTTASIRSQRLNQDWLAQ